jgi:hypothetical protein
MNQWDQTDLGELRDFTHELNVYLSEHDGFTAVEISKRADERAYKVLAKILDEPHSPNKLRKCWVWVENFTDW